MNFFGGKVKLKNRRIVLGFCKEECKWCLSTKNLIDAKTREIFKTKTLFSDEAMTVIVQMWLEIQKERENNPEKSG